MNWNNIQKPKFKVYDPELKQFFVESDDIAPKIISGHNSFETKIKDRYYVCYGESGLIFGFYLENGDWDECTLFPYSGYRDSLGNELYLFDKVKHLDDKLKGMKGVVDLEQGRWVIRYDSNRTAPLHDRIEYIAFDGHPDRD